MNSALFFARLFMCYGLYSGLWSRELGGGKYVGREVQRKGLSESTIFNAGSPGCPSGLAEINIKC